MHVAAHHTLTNSQFSSTAPAGGVAGWLASAFHRWRERAADRRELALMDDRALRDARLTRWEVELEMSRPFWRG
jgi:uncharacterized protein YjiS (DUF1127 family)